MMPAPKTKKILLGITLVLTFLMIVLPYNSDEAIQSANAVHVHPNVHFSPPDIKTMYTTNATFNFSHIVVENDALYLNNSIIKHIPYGGGRIEVLLDIYDLPHVKYTVITSGTVTGVNATLGGFIAGNKYTIKVDGTNWKTITASPAGQINFNYTSWSNHTFEILTQTSNEIITIGNVSPVNNSIHVDIVGNPPDPSGYVNISWQLNDSDGGGDMEFYMDIYNGTAWVNRLHLTNQNNGTRQAEYGQTEPIHSILIEFQINHQIRILQMEA